MSIDTIEFRCPTTGERCSIVDGYTAYLMKNMDSSLKAEQAVRERINEAGVEDRGLQITLDGILRYKSMIADFSDSNEFAAEVSAAAHLQNCSGPIEATDTQAAQILMEPEHLMDLCPMVGAMFPDVD